MTFSVAYKRFHCLGLEDNCSALLCDSSGSLMRSESPFCVILCGSAEVTVRKTSVSLEADGCRISQSVF